MIIRSHLFDLELALTFMLDHLTPGFKGSGGGAEVTGFEADT